MLAVVPAAMATVGMFCVATARIRGFCRDAVELRIPRHEQWIHRVQMLMLAVFVALPVAIAWWKEGPWMFGAEYGAYLLITGYAAITIVSQHVAMYLAWRQSRGEQELLLLMPRCPPFARMKRIFLVAMARMLVLPWIVWAAAASGHFSRNWWLSSALRSNS
jgi:hypothetical protein